MQNIIKRDDYLNRINDKKTVKGVKVSGTTVANYLNYLTESFLFSNAKRYDVKGKKYFEYPSKYYCTDIGLRNARLNFRQQEEMHTSWKTSSITSCCAAGIRLMLELWRLWRAQMATAQKSSAKLTLL